MQADQKARLAALNPQVEEEVTLALGAVTLVCFAAGRRPADLAVGNFYSVSFKLFALDDLVVTEEGQDAPEEVVRLGDGYAYKITGRMQKGRLLALGVPFDHEELASEFGHLDGSIVSIHVDRIGVKFLT
jgi:hypothetical protein